MASSIYDVEYKDANTTFEQEVKDAYLDDLRNLWDLYTTNSTVDAKMLSTKTYEDTTAEFSTGKVAFYQNGVWAYTQIKGNGVADEDLGMVPIYIGAEGEEVYGPACSIRKMECRMFARSLCLRVLGRMDSPTHCSTILRVQAIGMPSRKPM